MARRRRGDDERSMDSLMDALTNVVGILLLILIVSSLGISAAVRKVVENLPEVTPEELEAMKISRDKTLDNLRELQQTHSKTLENLPTDEESATLVAELEEFEKDNQELADKTSDIEEWQLKVQEAETLKDENEAKVQVADSRNRELAAILAQTPEVEVKQAKDVLMPNPRLAEEEARALYLICRDQKLYFVGDPYEHAFKIRDVIDQNFTDLAFTALKPGSYTYALKGLRKNDRGWYDPLTESFNLTRSAEKELAAWSNVNTVWAKKSGEPLPDRNVLERMFGNEGRREFAVHKFRYDIKKITDFFGEGKFGPKDFRYHVYKGGGDRVRFSVEPRKEAGWTEEAFLPQSSEFDEICKKAVLNQNAFFYYYVAPDSFDTYLQARAKSESYRIPAGWSIWAGDRLELTAVPVIESARYNLDTLPAAQYRKIADLVGPFLVREVKSENENFDERVTALVPKEMEDPKEQEAFIKKLSEERREFNSTKFQSYALDPFRAALAATKASGVDEVRIEIHPPEIPHIRVFAGLNPPEAPKIEKILSDKIGGEPDGGSQPVGGNQLILD